MAKRWMEGLLYLLFGFLGGTVLVALLALGYLALYSRDAQSVRDKYQRSLMGANVTSTAHQGPWPSVTPFATRTPGPSYPVHLLTAEPSEPLSAEFAPVVTQAENYLTGGQPQKVSPLLNDWLKQIDSDMDRTKAYSLLAEAEIAQGHYRIAAAHYQRLFYTVPTAENLMRLAETCEIAGSLQSSLNYYRLLLTYPAELTGADNRAAAQARIDAIKSICTGCDQTPTPGQ